MNNTVNRKNGNAASIMLAGIGIIAGILGIAGIRLIQNTARNASASFQSSVKVVQGSINANRRGDRKVLIGGSICFGSHINSGTETGVITIRNANGVELKDSEGSEHMQKILLSAGSSFPAPCDYVNTETGEAILKNRQSSGNSFNVTATFPQPLSSSYCPDVYLHYNGYNFSGTPFSRIKLSDIDGVCPRAPTSTPTPSPTGIPQTNPTQLPTQSTSGSFEGTIAVYSCKKPDYINVVFCDGAECNEDEPLGFSTRPSENGIWLTDDNNDNTWIYQYKISKNIKEQPLDPNKEYVLKGAKVFFGRDFYWSSREQNEKLNLKPPAKRDFEVDASPTCSCTFDAISYIKDPQGNYITSLDGKNGVAGTINNKQRAERPDAPIFNLPFNHLGNNPGRIDVHSKDYISLLNIHGRDGLASVKLFAPGWKVVGQECKSNNPAVPACPGYSTSWPPAGEDKAKYTSNVFDGLRVTCGTNLEYGWTLLSPTPTPSPEPGNGDLVIHTVFYARQEDPPSCSNDYINSQNIQIDPAPPGESKPTWVHFDWFYYEKLPITVSGPVTRDNPDGLTAGHRRFNQLPAGSYTISYDEDANRMDYMKLASNCSKTVEVKGETTTEVKLVFYVNPGDKYEIGDEVGNTCTKCLEHEDSTCGPAVAFKTLCLNPGSYTPSPEDDPPAPPQSGGGVCQQWCASPDFCRGRGYEPRTPPAGESCGGAGEQWCCPPGSSMPGGTPGGGGNPPAPPNSPPDNPSTICGDSSLGFDSECVTKNQCNYGDVAPHYNCGSSAVCCNVIDINEEPPENPLPGQPGRIVPSCPDDNDRYTWIGPLSNQNNCSHFEDYAGEARYMGTASDGERMYCCKINRTERPPSLGTCPPSSEYPNHTFGPVDTRSKCNPDQGGPGGVARQARGGSGFCCQVTPPSPPPADIPAYCKTWEGVYSGTLYNCEQCVSGGSLGYVVACNLCRRSALGLYSTCAGGSSCSDAADCDDCERNTLSGGARPLSESCTKCTRQSWACASRRGSLTSSSDVLKNMDLDSNGVINSLDLFYILEDYGTEAKINVDTVTADVNSDGFVNALDLSLVVGAFGQEVK